MKAPIKSTGEEVEVVNYFAKNTPGTLKGTFTIVIYPLGQKILDCKYFDKDGQRWFSFPSKEIKRGEKSEWIPIVSYVNKDYANELKEAVLESLKGVVNGKEAQGQARPAQGNAANGEANSPARQSPFVWQ